MNRRMLSNQDKQQLASRGISQEQYEKQMQQFRTGFSFSDIQRPATVGDGIARIAEQDNQKYVDIYNQALQSGRRVTKFVPASGAATRMFKAMFEFLNATDQRQFWMVDEPPYKDFLGFQWDFAFYPALKKFNPLHGGEVIEYMLTDKGLGYGQKPKGVILFHSYPDGARTAAEEHIIEGLSYASVNGEINLHFTVSEQHLELFKAAVLPTKNRLEKEQNCRINITYSFQKPSTDTPAATMDNEPFRTDKGELMFRPGGHGALIENLGDLDTDLVFVKNIDNVCHDHLLPITSLYKKVIAGYALERKNKVDAILSKLDNHDYTAISEAVDFMQKELGTELPSDFNNLSDADKSKFIYTVLDRPLRVCGMVKNEGEPGGGPFWVKGSDGQVTLQVVESAQIDTKDPEKAAIMAGSTHFNPVDLFCCITDRRGQKYNLKTFVDEQAGFISYKSSGGKDLKAMELPGLWNGAMARWLTFFVEVPIETFNPVKTVNDLLRPQHQPTDRNH